MEPTDHDLWQSLTDIKDSWVPLTETINGSLNNLPRADLKYRMAWRTVEMGFDILIEVRTRG